VVSRVWSRGVPSVPFGGAARRMRDRNAAPTSTRDRSWSSQSPCWSRRWRYRASGRSAIG